MKRWFRILGALSFIIGGCQVVPGGIGISTYQQQYSTAMNFVFVSSEPNGFLNSSEFVDLNKNPWMIEGNISNSSDIDIFNLGSVRVGDRIIVELDSTKSSLRGNIALIDENGVILLVNDFLNVYLGRTAPFIDLVIRRPGDSIFVAVASSPRTSEDDLGLYTLFAFKVRGEVIPPPRSDTIILMFNGGDDVQVGSRSPVKLLDFDAGDIDPEYADDTEEMIERIVFNVREHFAGTNITILSTSEGDCFGHPMSRIFFGGFNSSLLGIAEGVDEFNSTRAQEALVYIESFRFLMHLHPSSNEMATAIANITSHEIGHMLGLLHTATPFGIMSVRGSAANLLTISRWELGAIDISVFPMGLQDSVQMLKDLQE